jgi:DNA-binding CsgD family transcriptional regulator
MRNLHLIPAPAQSFRSLTPAEQAVLELAALANADIALLLGKTTATVKAQMGSAMVKLGAENRTAALVLWMRRTQTESTLTATEAQRQERGAECDSARAPVGREQAERVTVTRGLDGQVGRAA